MQKSKKRQININLIVFGMIFAITFVSIFTYIPLHSNILEQKTQQIKDDAEFQAILLKQMLRPVIEAENESPKKKATEKALKEIKMLWFQLNTDKPEQEFFLVHKNQKNNKIELLFSSKGDNPSPANVHLIKMAMYMSLNGQHGIQSISDDSKKTILAAYAPIISKKWGVVIKYDQQNITPPFIEAAGYTIFAALLISLISWLILRITFKRLNNRVTTSEERYHQLLVNSLDWVWETGSNGNISYSSSQVFNILGYTKEEVQSKPFSSFFAAQETKKSALIWQQKLMLNEAFNNLEISFYNKSKQIVHLLLIGHPILNKHKKLMGYRGIARDISALKHREGQMINMAFYDPLTKLANRTYFIDRLRSHLKSQTPENSLKPSALLFIDLDGFKKINDTKGHESGDQVLKIIAQRMQNHARKTDLVGRFGGDEFVILVNHMEKTLPKNFQEKMDRYLSRLLETIHESINLGDKLVTVGASIGIAIIPRDGKTVSDVLNHADIAMYQAKSKGKNNYQFYDQNTQTAVDTRLKNSAELRKAIENNEFDVYYQFQFNTLTDTIIGMEAFIRWHHPETHQILPANEFLKLAEDTNNIIAIDQWVINTVAQHIAKLNKQGITLPPISINLSTEELEENTLPRMVEDTIKRNFISAKSIRIEITETSLLHDLEKSSRTIQQLRNLGIKVCIDNFGTGYSSLSYLQALPIETIKMDKSFIQNIATSHSDLQMCRTFIQLAKSLQLDIIAEGVQSSVQKDILQKEGCYLSQGFLFFRPAPLAKIIKYLQENPLALKK